MPGLVLCNRRWAIGSDDIFMPAIILFVVHSVGATALFSVISSLDYDSKVFCSLTMFHYLVGYLMALLMILVVEFTALVVSCRGSVLDTKPRKFIQHIIYIRLVLMLAELGFIVFGIAFLKQFQSTCLVEWHDKLMRQTILTIVAISSVLIFLLILSTTCVYDRAGKSFYQLKMIESNYRKDPLKINHALRHLKHSHTLDLYQNSWKTRCNFLCCCVKQDDNKAAFGNIAETLSIFFYKYDVVPSDILAGLLLVYDKQKTNRNSTLLQNKLGIHDYMSGVPVTGSTKFFNLSDKKNLALYKETIYFFDYAAASYGWPFYAYRDHFACFKLMPNIKNCLFSKKMPCCNNKYGTNMRTISIDDMNIENDDCCFCYYDALTRQLPSADSMENLNINKLSRKKSHVKLIRANFTSDIGKPSYYVAIDFCKKKIVITIRGTESLKDSITDMQWKAMPLPNIDPELEWYGHEGIVKAASYLKNELDSKQILAEAFNYDRSRNTDKYDLLFVGHSMGGGVAVILSIMYKSEYADLKCYCYSPPGGLLSQPCMEATKEFITTIILGKDMVPRLGMVQLEKLRNEIMEALRCSKKPKWQILSTLCCYKCTAASQNQLMDSSTSQFKGGAAGAKDAKSTGFVISQPSFVPDTLLDKRLKYKSLSLSQNGSADDLDDLLNAASCTDMRNKSASLHVANFGLMNAVDESGNSRLCKKSLDASVYLTSPLPQVSSSVKDLPRLFPPGRILHIVRKYPKSTSRRDSAETSQAEVDENNHGGVEDVKHAFKEYQPSNKKNSSSTCSSSKSFKQTVSPVYQVIETDNKHFNELLISPRMLQDHIPDNLIKCMRAVLTDENGGGGGGLVKKPNQAAPTVLNVINEQPTAVRPAPTIVDLETNGPAVRKSKRRSVLESITHSFSASNETAADQTTKQQQRRSSSHSLQKLFGFSRRLKNVPIVKQYVLNSTSSSNGPNRVNQQQLHQAEAADVDENVTPVNKNYVSSSVLDSNSAVGLRQQQRQFKSLSLCSYGNSYNRAELLQLTPAPLAKPESCSDLLNEIEVALGDKSNLRLNSTRLANKAAAASASSCYQTAKEDGDAGSIIIINENEQDNNNMTFYDESFNFKNSLFELQQNDDDDDDDNETDKVNQISNQERANYRKHTIGGAVRSHPGQQLDNDDNEVKSSIIWWPYQDTNSNADTTNAAVAPGNTSNKQLTDGGGDDLKYSANSFKINLLNSDLDDENNSNMDDDDDDADDENQMNDEDDDDEREVSCSQRVQLIKNRIATSTPRGGDALSLLDHRQRQHSNLSLAAKQLATNYQNSSQSPDFGSLNDDINGLNGTSRNSKSNSGNTNQNGTSALLPEIHVSLLSTSLSTNDHESDGLHCGDDEADRDRETAECQQQQCTTLKKKLMSSKKHLMSKKLKRQSDGQESMTDGGGSLPRRSADLFSNDAGRSVGGVGINSSSNLVISSSSSASFGAINLNSINAVTDAMAHIIKLKSNHNQTAAADDDANNKIQDESITNFTSIEKLSILKPQSKDYILCFDTSSIDQNSSFASIDYNHQMLSACGNSAAATAAPVTPVVVKRDLNELITDHDHDHDHRGAQGEEDDDFHGAESKSVQSFLNHSLSNSSSSTGENEPHHKLANTNTTSSGSSSHSNTNGSSQNLNYEMLMSGNYDHAAKEMMINCPT